MSSRSWSGIDREGQDSTSGVVDVGGSGVCRGEQKEVYRRDRSAHGGAVLAGHGKSQDDEMASLERELARLKKERIFR